MREQYVLTVWHEAIALSKTELDGALDMCAPAVPLVSIMRTPWNAMPEVVSVPNVVRRHRVSEFENGAAESVPEVIRTR